MGNYFQVNKYLENYERALSGFEAAALKDPGLNAGEEVQKIVNLLDKLENSMKVMFSSFFIFYCFKGNINLSAIENLLLMA